MGNALLELMKSRPVTNRLMASSAPVGVMPNFSKLERPLYDSENAYFKSNPHVGGMATDDNRIVINPYSNLNDKEKDYVRLNEASRIFLRTAGVPKFKLGADQEKFLNGNEYANASDDDRRATILSRHLTGDPSAGAMTPEQQMHVDWLRNGINAWLGEK